MRRVLRGRRGGDAAPLALALMTLVPFINAAPSVAVLDDALLRSPRAWGGWAAWSTSFATTRGPTSSRSRPPARYRPIFLSLIQLEGMLFGGGEPRDYT